MARFKSWLIDKLWAMLAGVLAIVGFFASWAWCANAQMAVHEERLKGIDALEQEIRMQRSDFQEFLREYRRDMRRIDDRLARSRAGE